MASNGSPKTSSTINKEPTNFQNTLKRFSTINTSESIASPSSPQPSSPRNLGPRNYSPSPNGRIPSRSPNPRSPSAMSSLDARSSTPSLLRKASMNSLHGVSGVTPPRSSPSRASPSRSSSAQYKNGRSPLAEMEQEIPAPPRHTAASIAHNHFEKEMELHRREDVTRHADTIAILHDSCYGHRFSRPKTSRASLLTIVERPERIQASVLGLSVAYVRLGEQHSEGAYPLHPSQDPSSIPSGPFRIRKTSRKLPLNSPAVTNVHGVKWMEELKIMCDAAEGRLAMNGKELARPDMARGAGEEAPQKFHEGDLYLCAESLDAMEGALGAVCEGVDAIFEGSASGRGPHRAFVTIRPPGHHCSASYPSGFCWLNNVHVGISHATLAHGLTHAAIIDFDLHHGDGSQAIAWEHNARANTAAKNAAPWKKTSIGYFSLHDINSYPCEYGDEEKIKNASLCIENAHSQSIWNVHLQPWKSEAEFWELYETKYSILLEKTRNYLRAQTERFQANHNGPKPKGAIFLSAGFDASEWESSGMQRHKVNVPTEFYARLTRDVVKIAAEEGTSVDGRVISVLEGGYSDRALYSGVLSHVSGLAGGAPMLVKKEPEVGGLGYEMGQKIGVFNGVDNERGKPFISQVPEYDPLWWSLPRLEQLDLTVNGAPAPEERAPREGPAPTYSTPTQSFIAKVVSPSARRSVSSMSVGSPRAYARPPSPPPPEVHWTVAAHELSKILIPSDRQVGSCKPEDLSAEATRARRDRQSILVGSSEAPVVEAPPVPANARMSLRTRKPGKAIIEEDEEVKKPKTSRRRTVAGGTTLATEKAASRNITPIVPPLPSYSRPTSQSARRLSLVSNGSMTSDTSSRIPRAPSNGVPSVYPRPDTSQSIRPESSMSSRGHSIPPVVVKKTRAPAQPRAEPAKSSRIRRTSPLNGLASSIEQDESDPAAPKSHGNGVTAHSAAQPSAMDSLTSGMQKVKISLTTKAQREAKEGKAVKEPKELVKRAPKTTKRAPAKASKPQSIEIPAQAAQSAQSAQPQAPAVSTPVIKHEDQETLPDLNSIPEPSPKLPSTPLASLRPHFPIHVPQPSDIPLPASSPAGQLSSIPSLTSPSTSLPTSSVTTPDQGTNIFIPYQPEGPTPDAIPRNQAIHFLPPNTNTPSPMKRADLPVFTSTSRIQFAPNPNVPMPVPETKEERVEEVEGKDVDMWEVPETPEK
ncbi:Arginase/deacetylase [Glarea lozoyensis ATCC 20868]|uniref:Arginase/deacetylase n=1 Tax=Glarea lozoyensis (strain ATCC 20868 / MF5171) TaxID=1116229 RepID=S3DF77_GLAL2|nr:Arginase/deacetylase [Glarea lozoyensis ATCC 20868]EPE37077.1 Arginase/deacetylase [Glarea lozoyensis ATCC 20868]